MKLRLTIRRVPTRYEKRTGPAMASPHGAHRELRVCDGQTGVILSVQTVRPSTVLRPRAYPVSPTLGLRLERLVEVLGVNSRLGSLNPGFLVPQYYSPRGGFAVSLLLYQEWRRSQPSSNRAERPRC